MASIQAVDAPYGCCSSPLGFRPSRAAGAQWKDYKSTSTDRRAALKFAKKRKVDDDPVYFEILGARVSLKCLQTGVSYMYRVDC